MPANKWTFITNHAAVLTFLDSEEDWTTREIAIALNLTERSIVRIINDLEVSGYVSKRKEGRENRYTVNKDLPLRRDEQREIHVRELLDLISRKK